MTTTLESMQIHGTMFREMTKLVFNQNNILSCISVVYILMLHPMAESVLLDVLILNFLRWKMFPSPTFHLSVAKQVVRWTLRQSPKDKSIQASKPRTSQNVLLGLQIKGSFPSFSAKKSFRRQRLIAIPSQHGDSSAGLHCNCACPCPSTPVVPLVSDAAQMAILLLRT